MAARKKAARTTVQVKRVYETPAAGDGWRVLVDRLWPRGITKEAARIDLWLRDIAPSDSLRWRVHADPSTWDSFVADYAGELTRPPADAAVAVLRRHIAQRSRDPALRRP